MTRVRVLVAMAGPDQAWSVGDWYVCTEDVARHMVAAGRAEWPAPPAPDTAMTTGGAERAVKPKFRGRG